MVIQSNKVYDIVKYSATIFIPALNVLWVAVATVWGLPLIQEISITIAALNVFLGTIAGISSAQYSASTATVKSKK